MSNYAGELLKLKRLENGLTLETTSLRLGVIRQAVHHVESGRMKLPLEWIDTLCNMFHVKPSLFIQTLVVDYENELIEALLKKKENAA